MRAGLLVLALLLWPAARASAEWQIKPSFGATFGGGTTLPDVESAVGEVKRTFGASGVFIGEVFGVEADVGRTPRFFQTRTHSVLGGSTPEVASSTVTTITGNLVVAVPRRMTEYTLRPYVAGGGGVIGVQIENVQNRLFSLSSRLPALDIGGGAIGFLTDRLGVGWDVRYFHSIRGKNQPVGQGVGGPEQLSFWRINMAFVVRLRHQTR